jgi:hypothetical protein
MWKECTMDREGAVRIKGEPIYTGRPIYTGGTIQEVGMTEVRVREQRATLSSSLRCAFERGRGMKRKLVPFILIQREHGKKPTLQAFMTMRPNLIRVY